MTTYTHYTVVNTNWTFNNLPQTALQQFLVQRIQRSKHAKKHVPYNVVYTYTFNGMQQYAILDVTKLELFATQTQLDAWLTEQEDMLDWALAD